MSNWRAGPVLIAALAVGLSLAIPAEDVPETAYDESESLPCETAPIFSIEPPQTLARITQPILNSGSAFRSGLLTGRLCGCPTAHATSSGHLASDILIVLGTPLRC